MKKLRAIMVAILFCAIGHAGYTTYERMTMTEAEKFMLQNIEALTQKETDNKRGPYFCRTGKTNNSLTHITPGRYCGSCNMARISEITGDGECNLF